MVNTWDVAFEVYSGFLNQSRLYIAGSDTDFLEDECQCWLTGRTGNYRERTKKRGFYRNTPTVAIPDICGLSGAQRRPIEFRYGLDALVVRV